MSTKNITIYKLVNKINGKMYVGQTVDMKRRIREHTRGKNPNAAVHQAIAKHGVENFIHEIICVCANKTASDAVEIALIKLWKTQEYGYNLTPGGDGTGAGELNHRWGTKHNKTQHDALVRNNKARAGTPIPEERKRKISAQQKGRPRTEKQIAAVIANNKKRAGRKASAETRAKLSTMRKGVKKPEGFGKAASERMKEIWAARRAALESNSTA